MPRLSPALAWSLVLALTISSPSAHGEDAAGAANGAVVAGPVFSATGPDADAYGAAKGFPLGTRITSNQVEHLIASYSHYDELFAARPIQRAATPWLFKRAA